MTLTRAAVTLTATLATSLALTSCAGQSEDERLHVVAATTQICDYVKNLDADASLDLTCLLSPNASAHEHEMTNEQMGALNRADVVLVNGVDLERFLDQAIVSSGFAGTMTVTSGYAGAAPEGRFTVDEGVNKVDIAPWPFEPEPGEEAEFTFDPHVWTSPRGAAIQVENIADALDKASGTTEWSERASAYLDQLKDLDQWVGESLNSVPREDRVLFTSHDAFGYLARDYDIDFIGSALSDFNAQQDASAAHIKLGAQQVADAHAKVIFGENSNNAKSIEAIARAAGVRAVTGDDALYGDSLGPEGTDGATYIGSIVHNVTNLVRAWGGQVAPLPASLAGAEPKDVI
ncbi:MULTISPECIES: metal ABC transporter substrate-binding protein [unclassified Corynebacterium]|uniref:metal ABC transporter substrate-binding protein n=1 Tax=unclassified Corynebacterium TaxID=2624378 RepID=UPI002A90E982|nr:metal ABC transporter substrate-binding protein [Corynebacterium sp.]MDY5786276.1 metal ABC transporter substrate-binding protein [Corynebacterium sp.]